MNAPLGSVRRVNARRTGVGAVGDFNDLIANVPQAALKWQDVQHQFDLEGTPHSIQYLAQSKFNDAFRQLTTTVQPELAASEQGLLQAASAASGLTLTTSTISGAVTSVEGLVAAIQGGTPIQVVSSFAGAVIAALTISGVATAGVGAACAAAVAIASALLASFAPTVKATVCGVNITGNAPTFAWNCAWSFAEVDAAGPGTVKWRRFPDPAVSNDAWWYSFPIVPCQVGVPGACGDGQYNYQWTSSDGVQAWWGAVPPQRLINGGNVRIYGRPIDAAFPEIKQLGYDNDAVAASGVDPGFANFVRGFFGAWRSMKEFSINGLATPGIQGIPHGDDLATLQKFVEIWNTAHSSSSTYTIHPSPNGLADLIDPLGAPSDRKAYFVEMLVYEAARTFAGFLDAGGTTLTINTGPSPLIALGLAPAPSTASSLSTSVRVAAFALGSALIASSAIAYTSKRSLGSVWKNWFGRAKRLVKI